MIASVQKNKSSDSEDGAKAFKIDQDKPKDETSYKLQEKEKLVLKDISLQIKN
jgi:hypothetical protein